MLEALAKIQAGEKFDAVSARVTHGCFPLLMGSGMCHAMENHEGPCKQLAILNLGKMSQLDMQSFFLLLQVATQYSEDAARKGGDLGWKRRNELAAPFAEAAFKLQVRTTYLCTACSYSR